MRILTCNLNGIRSAHKKGFFAWIENLAEKNQAPDFLCLQETKAQLANLPEMQKIISHLGYSCFYSDAEKPGYSGVAVYTQLAPTEIITKPGWSCADTEGRYLQLDFRHLNLIIISLYLPSGSSGEHRQQYKFEFMKKFFPVLKKLRENNQRVIICGDWNIAHQNIDLKNWRSNQKNSGFLPEERAWLDKIFKELGWVDAFRAINPHPDEYTWWSNRGQAWVKNVGWRIDYHIVSPELLPAVQCAQIYKSQRFSDHAPLMITYDI